MPSHDLVRDYGHALDFDRLLATPRTIIVCWCLSALLLLAASMPTAFDVTRSLARDVMPRHELLAHSAGERGALMPTVGAPLVGHAPLI